MYSNHTCKILKLRSCLVKISLHLLSRIWSVGRFMNMILQRGPFLWQILTQFSSNPFPSCDILPSVWKWVLASPAEGASSIHCPKSHAVLWGSRSTGLPNDFGSSSLDNNSSDPFFLSWRHFYCQVAFFFCREFDCWMMMNNEVIWLWMQVRIPQIWDHFGTNHSWPYLTAQINLASSKMKAFFQSYPCTLGHDLWTSDLHLTIGLNWFV